WRFGIGGDPVDLRARLAKRRVEGRRKLARLEAVEWRRLEWSGPGFEKRIRVDRRIGHLPSSGYVSRRRNPRPTLFLIAQIEGSRRLRIRDGTIVIFRSHNENGTTRKPKGERRCRYPIEMTSAIRSWIRSSRAGTSPRRCRNTSFPIGKAFPRT